MPADLTKKPAQLKPWRAPVLAKVEIKVVTEGNGTHAPTDGASSNFRATG